MTEKFIPNPANYVMKGNKPAPPQTVVTAPEMPDLDQLSQEELKTLIRRLFGAVYGIGMMTEEDTARAFLDRLAIDGLTSRDARVTLANCNAWLDRKQGKPTQRIEQDIRTRNSTVVMDMTTDQLLAEIQRLQGGNEIKLLDNGMIDVTESQ